MMRVRSISEWCDPRPPQLNSCRSHRQDLQALHPLAPATLMLWDRWVAERVEKLFSGTARCEQGESWEGAILPDFRCFREASRVTEWDIASGAAICRVTIELYPERRGARQAGDKVASHVLQLGLRVQGSVAVLERVEIK